MKKNILFVWLLATFSLLCMSCTQDSPITNPAKSEPVVFARGEFAKGADVSWLTQMESEGYTFANEAGTTMECMKLLRDECGVNSIRLRVWVNPEAGWNNIDDVVVKARRAAALGMRIMIDFHYSDTWADPANQETPAAWADMNIDELKTAVADHTTEMLTRLKDFGVEPEWVQIGNETRGGFLYPLGSYDNGANYAALVNAGYDAVKAIFPDCTTIIHLDSGDKLYLYTRIFGTLQANGGKYDMIGMSLYPEADSWKTTADECISNINTVASTYGVPVMICEIGMSYDEAEACYELIKYIKTNGGSNLKGIFYWEPEAPAGYNNGYNKGCFDNGKPTKALDAFTED